MRIVKVIVADGHPAMRCGLGSFLNVPRVEIIGETGCGHEALRLVKESKPNLVILGLTLVGMDGVRTCQEIKALLYAPYVLVHSAYNFARDISSRIVAGADSYLHKRTRREELLDAVCRTAAGKNLWEVGEHVGEERSIMEIASNGQRLTPREVEVLAHKLRRHPNAWIAEELSISVHTVKHHVTNIYRKIPREGIRKLL